MNKKPTIFLLSVFLWVISLQLSSLAAADSKTSYDGKCASCHGADGKGKPKIAELLKVDISKLDLVDEETCKKSDPQLTIAIRDGVVNTKMKGYKDQFSNKDIAGLVKYIRSLKNE